MPVIANWKNKKEYPDEEKIKWNRITLNRFAWEFLRRNPNYQKDWKKFIKIYQNILPNYDPCVPPSMKDHLRLMAHPDSMHYWIPKLKGESKEEWYIRARERGSYFSLHLWYGKKWKLNKMFDPLTPYNKTLQRFLSFQTSPKVCSLSPLWQKENYDQIDRMIYPNITFDLTLPLRPQIKAAYEILLKDKKYLEKETVISPLPKKLPLKHGYHIYAYLMLKMQALPKKKWQMSYMN